MFLAQPDKKHLRLQGRGAACATDRPALIKKTTGDLLFKARTRAREKTTALTHCVRVRESSNCKDGGTWEVRFWLSIRKPANNVPVERQERDRVLSAAPQSPLTRGETLAQHSSSLRTKTRAKRCAGALCDVTKGHADTPPMASDSAAGSCNFGRLKS